jgi:1-acyl-sn-glycerol-3-phosphate acyltransferase
MRHKNARLGVRRPWDWPGVRHGKIAPPPGMNNTIEAPTGSVQPPPLKPSYWLARRFLRLLFGTYFSCRYLNFERVPVTGPAILACNHVSYMDPPLVGSALPREIFYLTRESLFRFPLFATLLRIVNCVPIDRDGGGAAGLKAILERLSKGHAIILFPEGTRSTTGQLQSARSGVGLLVIKSQAPVIPVRVFGTFEAYGRQVRLPRPHPVSVKFGLPLPFTSLRAEAAQCSKARLKEIYQEISNQIMAAIADLKPWADITRFP